MNQGSAWSTSLEWNASDSALNLGFTLGLLRPEAVDELAHRQGRQERGDAGEGEAETDLGGGQPDDLGEEHRRAGHEGALTEGEEERLGSEPSSQR